MRTLCRYVTPLLCLAASLVADEPATYRTDDNPDEKLPWFQLVDGEFPPDGSAHYFSGELIHLDHLERTFIVRVDRTDRQNRSHFDLPVVAQMLPYGSIWYRGAPAAMRDLPVGTHLHGWYYEKSPDDDTPPLEIFHNRRSYEVDFTRCLKLEDDFSYHARQNQLWRVDEVKLDEKKLLVTLLENGESVGDQQTYDLLPSTRVWRGDRVATLDEITAGQEVLLNITWATLYGPGRIVDLWLDEQSRELSTVHQLKHHHDHIRQRGLPGWVDEVDNQQRIVTVTLFGNVDPDLIADLKQGSSAGLAVATDSLLAYDPVNDRKSGPVLEVKEVAQAPGSSGVQARIQPSLLLEGYRPGEIVRVYPSGWQVIALPREEELFGR